jgi:hypothetical protein
MPGMAAAADKPVITWIYSPPLHFEAESHHKGIKD